MKKAFIVAHLAIKNYLEDKGDLAFGILLPVVIFALMYGTFGGQDMFHGTAHIVNEDPDGSYSTLLIDQLDSMDSLDVKILSKEDAEIQLERSDMLLALFIPEGFSSDVSNGQNAELTFRQRGNGGQEGQIVASLVRSVIEDFNREFYVYQQVNSVLEGEEIPQDTINVTVEQYLEQERENPVIGITTKITGSSPDPVKQFLPGIITMFVLFAITLNARALVEERRTGTLERLLTTRLSIRQLFFGKFLSGIVRGFIQVCILLILSYIVFQIFTPLTFIEALVAALIFCLAASAIGMLIASIARTEDQAVWTAVVFTMIMVMLSGTFFPIPEGSVLETISLASINTYAISMLDILISQGGSLANAWLEITVLLGVAIAGLAISRGIFKVMPGGR